MLSFFHTSPLRSFLWVGRVCEPRTLATRAVGSANDTYISVCDVSLCWQSRNATLDFCHRGGATEHHGLRKRETGV